MTTSERIYRALLFLYPRTFREEYGDEMSLLFRSRAAEGTVRLWLQVAADLVFHAPHEHWTIAKQDLRNTWRSWGHTPTLPAVALTALTLGMTGIIGVFSIVYALLLRPLPVLQPERLMLVGETGRARGAAGVSLPDYLSWRDETRALELTAFSGQTVTWTHGLHAERLEALAPTASFLSVVGTTLRRGRWFTEAEERRGRHQVAVLSDRLWRTRFGSADKVLGRRLMLNGVEYAVIGVAPPELVVPFEPDLWVPQVIDRANAGPASRYLTVLGRLKPGVSRRNAEAELTTIARGLEQAFPDPDNGFGVRLVAFDESLVSAETRTALIGMLAAAALVLLIACANVANLLSSRVVSRRRELAIRSALGDGTARITRQLLTEGVVLSLVSGVAALLLSAAAIAVGRGALARLLPRADDITTLNLPVAGFALGLMAVTTVGCVFAPLWQIRRAPRANLAHEVLSGARPPARHPLRTALVVGQVSLMTLLLAAAGLAVQSLINLRRTAIGFDGESVLTAKLALTRTRLENGADIDRFLTRLTNDLERTPEIVSAGISSAIPLSAVALTTTLAATDGGPFVACEWRLVDAGYFRTLGVPLLRGRLFEPQDRSGSGVVVISQQAARTLFGADDPIGRKLRLEIGRSARVVGVVADVRMRKLSAPPEPVVYLPPSQFGFFPLFTIVARAHGQPESAVDAVRDSVRANDPQLAAYDIHSMRHWVDRSSSSIRIRAWLLAAMSGTASLLGVIGIYGVMAHFVAQHTRDYGIRVALGARARDLLLGVMTYALGLAAVGSLLGLLLTALVADRIKELLFEVSPRDPTTFIGVAVAVALASAAASYIPALRAARTDPLVVLGAE